MIKRHNHIIDKASDACIKICKGEQRKKEELIIKDRRRLRTRT